MLDFSSVSKKFGISTALDNISFTISSGEFVFLVGPSGAGKTTILKLIINDMVPTSGKITFDGKDITKLHSSQTPYLRRKIGMIFQDFKVLNDRTILENVSVALEILGKKKSEIISQSLKVLKLVGLGNKADFFPAQLSAGELQRVAIARAVIGNPKMLLADEPTGNLDPKTGWDILKLLSSINKKGTTIIMATHNADIVNSMDKRVIKLSAGKMIKDVKKGKYN
ncbi:cell division ATP-binding protein FtsE [Candidatus Gottesmanbacteria bacterium]|nr:cell division ATP-binding protein FtsE [Candidatus Gottesmanbacteria bacterium]